MESFKHHCDHSKQFHHSKQALTFLRIGCCRDPRLGNLTLAKDSPPPLDIVSELVPDALGKINMLEIIDPEKIAWIRPIRGSVQVLGADTSSHGAFGAKYFSF